MIPTRVSLKNFLTFAGDADGTPIVFDFEGATLWSIAGVNGAGKSAVFDAITYALFGEHRGGRQHDNRLIRKGATTAEVTFEFLQGGDRYRVERSITRKFGRQGQARSDSKHVQASVWVDSDDAWVAVPDTDKATELERWVKTLLGMGPETFSSSVLLRQGEADKLLNAKANQRFKILAGLIDLRAYQRLEQLAVERRKTAETSVEVLDQQLADVADVTDEQLAHAASELGTADAAAKAADEQRVDADRCHQGAQRHADLQRRLREQTERRAELVGVVSNAVSIRASAAEFDRLEIMIEPVEAALSDLLGADAAAAAAYEAASRLGVIDLAALETDAAETSAAQDQFDDEMENLNQRAHQLARVVADVKEIVRCRRDHAQRAAALTALGEPDQLTKDEERLGEDLNTARQRLDELGEERSGAIDRRGGAQSRVQAATERLSLLDELSGEPTCGRCGQPITAEHLDLERADANAALGQARADHAVEQRGVTEFDEAIAKATTAIEDLDQHHRDAARAVAAAQSALEELQLVAGNADAAISAATPADFDDEAAAAFNLAVHGDLEDGDDSIRGLSTMEKRTTDAIGRARAQRDDAKKKAQAAQKALDVAREERGRLQRDGALQHERAGHLKQQAELRLRDLPEDVVSAARSRDGGIVDQLRNRIDALVGAAEELHRLETAEEELTGVTGALSTIDKELALIPEEHRVPVADAQSALDAADEACTKAQERRDHSRDEHTRLADAHRTRSQVATKLGKARVQARVARRLAALLGKNELQGRLLTEATNGVEAYANDTLARISGGTLELELRGEESGDGASLDIFVQDRASADEALEVAFISGSQKFRVAVALAAGLGQYLGGNTAIRSLIIDEGFGSLDVDGRHRMIEELRALAEHLDRVIVVSHQDDFTDRTLFPTGFVLRKEGTQTMVERVG